MDQTLVKKEISENRIEAEQSKNIAKEPSANTKFNQVENLSVMSTDKITKDDKISPSKIESQIRVDIKEEEKTKEKPKRSKINIAEKIKEIEQNLGEMLGIKPGKIKVKVTKIKNQIERKVMKQMIETDNKEEDTQQVREPEIQQVKEEKQQVREPEIQQVKEEKQQVREPEIQQVKEEKQQVREPEIQQVKEEKQQVREPEIQQVKEEKQQVREPEIQQVKEEKQQVREPEIQQVKEEKQQVREPEIQYDIPNDTIYQQPPIHILPVTSLPQDAQTAQSILLSFQSNIFSININPLALSPQTHLAQSLLSQINFLKLKLSILQIRRSISGISHATIDNNSKVSSHKLRHSSNKKHSNYRGNINDKQIFDQLYCQSMIVPSKRNLDFQENFLQYANRYFYDFKLGIPKPTWIKSQLQAESQSAFRKLGIILRPQSRHTLTIKRYNNCFALILDSSRALFWYFYGRFYYGAWSSNSEHLCEKNGWGYDYYPQKYVYSGTYQQNKKNGYGMIKYFGDQQGVVYEGQWRNGRKEGLGKQREKDQTEYIGNWSRGLQNGAGRLKLPNQQLLQVVFSEGNIQSQRKIQSKSLVGTSTLENPAKVKFKGKLRQQIPTKLQQQIIKANVTYPLSQKYHTKIPSMQ